MHTSVKEYEVARDKCQRAKYESLLPTGLLQYLPIPSQIWEDVSINFINGLPRSENHTSIMVVVDRFTKFAHLVPMAANFIEFVVKFHETSKSIFSYRDPVFVSALWKDLWRLSGTKLHMSSTYHPQTDGQTEVFNCCIKQFLRCFIHNRPKHRNFMLPWRDYWYNTSHHSSTGMTPFKALYGRDPPPLDGYESGSIAINELDEQNVMRYFRSSRLTCRLRQPNETS